MLRLFIDNTEADLNSDAELSISLSIASLTSTSWGRASYSKSITIPATPRNRGLMGDCEQPLAAQHFNHTGHTARVEADGCVIIEGQILVTASRLGGEGYYRFNIIGNAREWVRSASARLVELMPDWSCTFDKSTIAESWTEEGALVRFLPVERGRLDGQEWPNGRVTEDTYHPFIHLRSLLGAIFAEAGYAIESQFLDSDYFNRLYMSGRWSEREFGSWAQEMDFEAVRLSDSESAEADVFGRVYTNPLANYSTVGNPVDMPDGERGTFNNGALETDSTGRICFRPSRELAAGFIYKLRWESDHRIKSRTRLEGFTELRPNFGDSTKVILKNPFEDKRGEVLSPDMQYRLFVFDPVEGATYRLLAKEITNSEADPDNLAEGDYTTRTLLTTTERATPFVHHYSGPIVGLRLEMELDGELYSPASDWAIYEGYVEEYGRSRLEATIVDHPDHYGPSNPKYFDMFFFGGAREGMSMKMLAGSSLRPLLVPHPVEGDLLLWRDVANLSATGLDLIGALKELFDLQIYTDTATRRVIIEPHRDFCREDVVVDLLGRVDESKPIMVEELGADQKRTIRLSLLRGDRRSDELSAEEGVPYGQWCASIDHLFAAEGEHLIENSLFAPSVEVRGSVVAAPSARLLGVGDSAAAELPRAIAYRNFTPKIVAYEGVVELPAGERWEYPTSGGAEYPLVRFFDDGSEGMEPLSLLYEDRAGVEGLHKWWDGRIEALNHSRRLTLYITLRAEEIEALVAPNSQGRDFRALYSIPIGGESVLCRLEEIVDYNPSSPSTKAVFVTVA